MRSLLCTKDIRKLGRVINCTCSSIDHSISPYTDWAYCNDKWFRWDQMLVTSLKNSRTYSHYAHKSWLTPLDPAGPGPRGSLHAYIIFCRSNYPLKICQVVIMTNLSRQKLPFWIATDVNILDEFCHGCFRYFERLMAWPGERLVGGGAKIRAV